MMSFYFIFTKRGLAVILALVIVALIIIGQFSTINRGHASGATHRERMEFLLSAGLEVCEEAVCVKESRIPQKIEGDTKEYFDVFKSSGFKITDYIGQPITVYTYRLQNFPEKTVNLIVLSGKIIAGEVTDTLKGAVSPIEKEK